MTTPSPIAAGYYHPHSEEGVRDLISFARESGLKLRVKGAGHSEKAAYEAGHGQINVLLDKMRKIEFDDQLMRVTVGAGCHLGYDPEDPTSSRENGLFAQLEKRGWAVPDMGGITRQTVGGFLSTGSAGGSLQHTPSDHILRFKIVDGTGAAREFSRDDNPDNPFWAVGVSLGLFGVITEVTMQCVPRYEVQGVERTSNYAGCEIDLFGPGDDKHPSLQDFLQRTEHSRLLWWPQNGVERVTVWKAAKVPPGTPIRKRAYKQVRTLFGSPYPAYLLISLALRAVDTLNPPRPRNWFSKITEKGLGGLYKIIAGQMLRPETQEFCDAWWRTLPMDDGANYKLLPTGFTELWIPIDRTGDVMRALHDHFAKGGFPATGTYACELYASPASRFWMSPAFGRPVLKVDFFWFKKSRYDPSKDFYPQFWELLQSFDYTLHWAKAQSGDVDYLKQRYPRWRDFLALRKTYDPAKVFLTDYWKATLGLD